MNQGRRRIKGSGAKAIPLTPEVVELVERQLQAFRQKFGREPRPGDPLFFDPMADTPQVMNEEVVEQKISEAMHQAGIDPAKIYATQKTGFLPTAETWPQMSPTERREWNDAIAEYETMKSLEEEPMTEEELLGMIVNPIYAGVGPYPQVVPDAKWIAAVGKAIEEVGTERVLTTMLEVLRQAWAAADHEEEGGSPT